MKFLFRHWDKSITLLQVSGSSVLPARPSRSLVVAVVAMVVVVVAVVVAKAAAAAVVIVA